MECPHCTAALPDDDVYCEECGKPLEEEDDVSARCSCGAPVADADEDGFCSSCGRRVRARESDHLEEEISPFLAAVSDKGRIHDHNEDGFAIWSGEEITLLVVCDGVSNSREPERASALAVQTVKENVTSGAGLRDAMAEAARAVASLEDDIAVSRWLSSSERDGAPSTTAVAALVRPGQVEIAWAGDSRAYWISADNTVPGRQFTTDHSWMNRVLESGEMTREQAEQEPRAHAITRWLGADASEDTGPEIIQVPVDGSGWLLLCSDGLWNYVREIEDLQRLFRSDEPETALAICRRLVAFANDAGGHDNITAAILAIPAQQNGGERNNVQ